MNPRTSAVFFLALCAAGCATSDTSAILGTTQWVLGRGGAQAEPKLDPKLRYLRVTISGRVVYLALGYYDPHPHGTIEVWYSGDREAVRLQDGRLVGVSGFSTEWRNVVAPALPRWSALADGEPFRWVRTRDLMPGYRYGVRDSLALRKVPPPQRTALRELDGGQLAWFEERFAEDADSKTALPPARYAVQISEGRETVVYGEQCITPQACLAWQRWPAGK